MFDEFFEFGGGDAFGALEGDDLATLLFAPAYGFLKTGMLLVGTFYEDVEIHFLHDVFHIAIDHYFIYVADGASHIAAFLCGVEQLGFGLECLHHFRILYSHNEVIAQGSCLTEQLYVSDMEQVVNTNGKYFLHGNMLYKLRFDV